MQWELLCLLPHQVDFAYTVLSWSDIFSSSFKLPLLLLHLSFTDWPGGFMQLWTVTGLKKRSDFFCVGQWTEHKWEVQNWEQRRGIHISICKSVANLLPWIVVHLTALLLDLDYFNKFSRINIGYLRQEKWVLKPVGISVGPCVEWDKWYLRGDKLILQTLTPQQCWKRVCLGR